MEDNISKRCPTLRLIRIYSGATAQLHALDALSPRARRLSRAEEGVGDSAEGFGFAGRAGLEGAAVLVHVPRDVEGVALSVAEAVDDGAAQAALLVDGLLQRLRLAPVHPQVTALGDVQRLLAGLQHLVGGHQGRRPPGNESTDGRLQAALRFVLVVFIGVREGALKISNVHASHLSQKQTHELWEYQK